MKKYLIILIAAIFFAQAQSLAQTDSRNRTPETVIADALAQMPAKDSRSYSLLMGEMASTGSAGILQIASTMNYGDGKASAGEYALQGLASYVMTPEGGRHRDEVRKGLKLAIGRSGDVRKKRFLIASLALCATPADLPDLIAIANDNLHTVRNSASESLQIITLRIENNNHICRLHGGKHAIQCHIKEICLTSAGCPKSQ